MRFKLLLSFCLGAAVTAFAQNNPDRWNTDGNLGDTNKYMGTTNAEPIIFKTDSVERMRITANGRVGINVRKPQARLDVKGNVQFRQGLLLPGLPAMSNPLDKNYSLLLLDSTGSTLRISYFDLLKKVTPDGYIAPEIPPNMLTICDIPGYLNQPVWYSAPYKIYSECPEVKVGIATSDPQESLDVRGTGYFERGLRLGINHTGLQYPAYLEGLRSDNNENPWMRMMLNVAGTDHTVFLVQRDGGIYCTSARVRVKEDIPVPDFVFQPDYRLMPLEEVKDYVHTHSHLPGIPSESEIREHGLSLEEMQLQLLQKVEELTLYLIELKEENRELRNEINTLKTAKP